jgi:phage terminase large subunit-like protein
VVLADAVEKDGEEAVQQLQQQFHPNVCFVKCDVTQSADITSMCVIFAW